MVLCGVRDVRDYRMHRDDGEVITGGSAFNIKSESIRLHNFNQAEVAALLQQHTDATGQTFEAGVLEEVWADTQGQPWLVNALAYEACFRPFAGQDRTQPISVERMRQARESLILRRDTHLDQLADKLREPRVRRVVEPIVAGLGGAEDLPDDDIQYCRDLGLIGLGRPLAVANRIYREVIPRQLTWSTQETMVQSQAWYVSPEGHMDMPKLLAAFQQFFRENAHSWLERHASNFSGKTHIAGWSAMPTKRPDRSCCCKPFCSASSMEGGALRANTAWAWAASICLCSGRSPNKALPAPCSRWCWS
jgi:hypothetical protein